MDQNSLSCSFEKCAGYWVALPGWISGKKILVPNNTNWRLVGSRAPAAASVTPRRACVQFEFAGVTPGRRKLAQGGSQRLDTGLGSVPWLVLRLLYPAIGVHTATRSPQVVRSPRVTAVSWRAQTGSAIRVGAHRYRRRCGRMNTALGSLRAAACW